MDLESTQTEPTQGDKRSMKSSDVESKASSVSSESMSFNSWAARPVPRRRVTSRESFDFDAFKIFLILAGLTAGMALALRSLF